MNIDWDETIEKVKRRAQITSDKELAELLGVTKQALSEYRNKRNELGWQVKLRLLDLLGYQSAREMILALLPKDKAEEIRKINNEITKRWNSKKTKEEK